MKLNEWLEEPSNEKLLREHNEALEEAKTHEGKRPEQKGSLRRLQRRFKSEQKKHEIRVRRKELEVLFTPPMYPPCTVPTADLRKTLIKDLEFEARSDSYIFVKTANRAVEMSAVMVIAEDEDGNVVLLRILREFLLCHGGRLDEGMVLLVKQPCLQWISDKEYEIRVDHVSDIMFVPLFDERVPLSWRGDSLKDISGWSFEKWAEMGDEVSNKGEHHFAVEWYTKALECSPPAQVAAIIFFLRSNGYFQTHRYEAALHDLEQATECPEISEHRLRRKAQVLYHLERYQECCEAYKTLLRTHPGLHSDKEGFNIAIARLAEQQHGKYDFKAMQDKAIHSRTLLLDHATYKGPITLKESNLHGQGLFTTQAVKAGDLLLCEKAFSYIFSQNKTITPSTTIQVNTETKYVSQGPTHDLTTATMQKMTQSPSSIKKITSLHRGTFPAAITTDQSNAPVIDTFLLSQITTLNSFGSPLTSQALHTQSPNDKRIMARFSCTGIWPSASSINHSCASNTRRAFIGDLMIVRAARDIPAHTELTWWYKFPAKEGVTDTSHWGFECACEMCVGGRGVERGVRQKRAVLRGQVWGIVNADDSLGRGIMVDKIGVLEGLFGGCGFGVWDVLFRVARLFLRCGEDERAVEFVGRGFGALGFVVMGVWPLGESVVVREWGVVVDEVVDAWVVLYLAFLKIEPGLAVVADRYARLAYLICVGEDESFDEVYGKKSGRPYGPADPV